LDENQLLINAIVEHHEQGKLAVVTQYVIVVSQFVPAHIIYMFNRYQLRLQQNLIFLATLADAPPGTTLPLATIGAPTTVSTAMTTPAAAPQAAAPAR
jgi:hypothetical protein